MKTNAAGDSGVVDVNTNANACDEDAGGVVAVAMTVVKTSDRSWGMASGC